MYELTHRDDHRVRLERGLTRADVETLIGPPELEIVPRPSWKERVMWAYPQRGLYLYFNADSLAAWCRYPEGYHRTTSTGR